MEKLSGELRRRRAARRQPKLVTLLASADLAIKTFYVSWIVSERLKTVWFTRWNFDPYLAVDQSVTSTKKPENNLLFEGN